MFNVDLHDNRVLVARIDSCETVEEAKQVGLAVRDALSKAGPTVVASCDFRKARVFPPPVTEVFVAILRADNPRLERSAHVLGQGASFTLQIERLVREAGSPSRKTFPNADDAYAWLAELLTPQQQAWLRRWYDEK